MRAEHRKIMDSIQSAMEQLPESKLEFLRGYAEGLIAQRPNQDEAAAAAMKKAG